MFRGVIRTVLIGAALAAFAGGGAEAQSYNNAQNAYDLAMMECSLPVFPFYDITVGKLSDSSSFQMTEEKAAFLKDCMKERGFSYDAKAGDNNYYQTNKKSGVGSDGLTDKERNSIRRYYQQALANAGLAGGGAAPPSSTARSAATPAAAEPQKVPPVGGAKRIYNYSGAKKDNAAPKPIWLPRN